MTFEVVCCEQVETSWLRATSSFALARRARANKCPVTFRCSRAGKLKKYSHKSRYMRSLVALTSRCMCVHVVHRISVSFVRNSRNEVCNLTPNSTKSVEDALEVLIIAHACLSVWYNDVRLYLLSFLPQSYCRISTCESCKICEKNQSILSWLDRIDILLYLAYPVPAAAPHQAPIVHVDCCLPPLGVSENLGLVCLHWSPLCSNSHTMSHIWPSHQCY